MYVYDEIAVTSRGFTLLYVRFLPSAPIHAKRPADSDVIVKGDRSIEALTFTWFVT